MINLAAGFRSGPFRSLTLDEKISLALALGLDNAEVNLIMVWREGSKNQFKDFSAEDLLWIKQQLSTFSNISVHGPYGVSINSYNQLYRKLSIEQIKDCIHFAAFIGASVVATHLEPTWPRLELVGLHKKRMIESLRILGDYASAYEVKLAIETQYPFPADIFIQLIAETDHSHVGATLDTGHLFIKEVPYNSYISLEELTSSDGPQIYNQLLMKIATQLGDMGKLLHVHLNGRQIGTLEDHFVPDSNSFIDFPVFYAYLQKIQYKGSMVLELELEADGTPLTVRGLRKTLEVTRSFWNSAGKGKLSNGLDE